MRFFLKSNVFCVLWNLTLLSAVTCPGRSWLKCWKGTNVCALALSSVCVILGDWEYECEVGGRCVGRVLVWLFLWGLVFN
jgi:hypothetical protein